MKMRLGISMACLVLLFWGVDGMAQRPQRPQRETLTLEQRAERMAQRMTDRFSLSEEQNQQIEKIYLKHFEQVQKANEERLRRMQNMEDQIKQVLTAEQREQWEKDQAAMRERMNSRGRPSKGNRGPGPGPCVLPEPPVE